MALGSALAASSCFGAASFACDDSAQCVVEGVQGVCEPSGFCSFFDDSCPSGRRFSPFAGDGLGGECVAGDDESGGVPTSTGSGASSGAGSASTNSRDDGESSEGPGASTGCETSCAGAGTLLWSTTETELGDSRGHSVAITDGQVVVTGFTEAGGERDVLVARFAADTGTPTSSMRIDNPGDDTGWSVAALPRGSVALAGEESAALGEHRGFVMRVSSSDEIEWKRIVSTLAEDSLRAVAASETRIVAAGQLGADGIVIAHDHEGVEVYSRLVALPENATGGDLRGTAATAGGSTWVVGSVSLSNDEAWVTRLTPRGSVAVQTVQSQFQHALAVAPTTEGGAVVGGQSDGAGWLGRMDATGTFTSTRTVGPSARVQAIASAPDGRYVAAGTATGGSAAWVTTYDPDGTERWSFDDGADRDAYGATIADDVVYIVGERVGTTPAAWVAAFLL